jgi:uncharacterized repeat protein (TIGR03803 family)
MSFTIRSHYATVAAILLGTGVAAEGQSLPASPYTVYNFAGTSAGDGATPNGSLIAVGSTLYGLTTAGGTNGNGTIYSYNPLTKAETPVYSFGGSGDGAKPYGALCQSGSILYGTTSAGGGNSLVHYHASNLG